MSKYRRLEKRVKKLEEELTEDIKEIDGDFILYFGYAKKDVPTLKAQVDEIVKYLNLNISVKKSVPKKVTTSVIKKGKDKKNK